MPICMRFRAIIIRKKRKGGLWYENGKKGTLQILDASAARLIKIYHGFAPELWWCVTAQAMLQVAGPFVNLYFSARILSELIGGRDAQRLGSYVLLTLICNLSVFLFSQGIGKINSVAQSKVMWKELRSVGDTFLKTDYENLGDAGYQNKKRYYLERRTMDGALCWGQSTMCRGW